MTLRESILLVVPDPGVGRVLARDLRGRYGDRHDVVRTAVAVEGTALARALDDAGIAVAVVIADLSLPEDGAAAVLEAVLAVAPETRRVVLSSRDQTAAALRLVEALDLDGHLAKPWGLPGDRLAELLDEQLAARQAALRGAETETTLVGHLRTSDAEQTREFLVRNQLPFRSVDADSVRGRRLVALADEGAGSGDMPLVLLPDGQVLVRPTAQQLARSMGLTTSAGSPRYDLVVVGGGPAGLGAAVYGASEGLRTLLVEREATGGQAGTSSRIENYLGFPHGVSGADLAHRARDQAARFGAEILTTAEVTGLEPEVDGGHVVSFADGSTVTTLATVLATGVRYRRIPAASVDAFTGRGVSYGAAAHTAADCAGERVFVVGAANSAGQAALAFARHACEVTLLCRGRDLSSAMSRYLVDRIAAAPNIVVRARTEVVGGRGGDRLEQVRLQPAEAASAVWVDCQRLFLFIGAAPQTDWLGDRFLRDGHGFLLTGQDLPADPTRPLPGWSAHRQPLPLEASVPGVFVAGDVRSGSVKRVASAVGEGAMAVSLVHRHLAGASR